MLYKPKYQKVVNYSANTNYLSEKCYKKDIGVVYRCSNSSQLVDGLGMTVPFLMHYYERRKNEKAFHLCKLTIDNYFRFGVDSETGIPSHGFMLEKPYLKQGSINWGRGLSWFLLCLNTFPVENLNQESLIKYNRLNTTLVELYHKNKDFSQFLGGNDRIDLTATLPVILYLNNKGFIKLDREQLLYYSRYMRNGVLLFSSGPTECMNSYSPFTGENMLSQAVMMFLLNGICK